MTTTTTPAYTNLVTLRSGGQTIEGYASGRRVYISRLGRFHAAFSPEGTLIILHNYDEPGKIGGVGTVLGKKGINIRFMQVASLLGGTQHDADADADTDTDMDTGPVARRDDEALMILGISGEVDAQVVQGLRGLEGVLDVSLVRL
ncbi:hypothetical protein CDD82_2706 [Ophiocordyceps australis]|uniref:ACT domain-containing protein n=1 Tax=Ophiocordyceps australis TaxID=1399860 RepID=A0A2C5X709_9HYPO|nr:hypothetical protein CDD82_2706 [Ophiocordyceps australis]